MLPEMQTTILSIEKYKKKIYLGFYKHTVQTLPFIIKQDCLQELKKKKKNFK